jgi:DNA-binding CsgD family transcriptional regulator
MQKQTVQPVSIKKFKAHFLQYKLQKKLPNPQKIFAPTIATVHQFAMGPYYWNIGNVPDVKMIAVGGDVETLTPYKKEQWLGASPEFAFSHILPEDIPYAMAYVVKLDKYMQKVPMSKKAFIKASVYVRMQNAKGVYDWCCIQYPKFYYDKKGNLMYVFALVTNIAHIKTDDGNPFLSILDTSTEEQHLFTCNKPDAELELHYKLPSISEREIQILQLLAQGKTSKEIGDVLAIAKNTVDNRRQALLKKFAVKSSAELINFVVHSGLL